MARLDDPAATTAAAPQPAAAAAPAPAAPVAQQPVASAPAVAPAPTPATAAPVQPAPVQAQAAAAPAQPAAAPAPVQAAPAPTPAAAAPAPAATQQPPAAATAAQPTTTEAASAIAARDIEMLRKLATPPVAVKTLLTLVVTLLQRDSDWETARKAIGEPGFLDTLKNIDVSSVPSAVVQRVQGELAASGLTQAAMGRVAGPSMVSMLQWVEAVIRQSQNPAAAAPPAATQPAAAAPAPAAAAPSRDASPAPAVQQQSTGPAASSAAPAAAAPASASPAAKRSEASASPAKPASGRSSAAPGARASGSAPASQQRASTPQQQQQQQQQSTPHRGNPVLADQNLAERLAKMPVADRVREGEKILRERMRQKYGKGSAAFRSHTERTSLTSGPRRGEAASPQATRTRQVEEERRMQIAAKFDLDPKTLRAAGSIADPNAIGNKRVSCPKWKRSDIAKIEIQRGRKIPIKNPAPGPGAYHDPLAWLGGVH